MGNEWEFPIIKRCDLIPDFLIGYRKKMKKRAGMPIKKRAGMPVPGTGKIGCTHFFLDDFRFCSIWNDPHTSLDHIKTSVVLSPDFSLYRDWPLALQIWNTYRNRWCAAFWQSRGLDVIPTVSWSGPASYDFCFDAIEPGGVVALSMLGVKGTVANYFFMAGFFEMKRRINPSQILCYGNAPESLADQLISYPTFWQKKQAGHHGRTRRH